MTFIIGIVLGGAVVIFALQNLEPVMVSFLGFNFEGSVALIVLISMLIGVLVSLLLSLSSAISGMMNESRLKRHNESLKKELDEHKTMLSEANRQIAQKPTENVIVTEVK